MKKLYCTLLILAATGQGCVTLPVLPLDTGDAPKSASSAEVVPAAPAPREQPPVTVSQVNSGNAHEMARALQNEIERELAEPAPAVENDPTEP